MKRSICLTVILAVLAGSLLEALPARADDRLVYISQPDEAAIFLNDIAYARDAFTLPGAIDAQVVLPLQVYRDTLILREDGERVATYRLRQDGDRTVLQWESDSQSDLREVTLEYLLSGLGWSPTYNMWIGSEEESTVRLDFFAEIRNNALALEDVAVRLIAGRVDIAQQISAVSTVTANQYIAGYEEASGAVSPSGPVTIQHVYSVGDLSSAPGEVVYTSLLQSTLPARRLILWNAQTDRQATVIYKVRNESDLPLAEGIVRSYQNDLFIGSDFIEVTPIGSEGSVTVGGVQDLRVFRSETTTYIENAASQADTRHEITLRLDNFSDREIEVEVVDSYPTNAQDFVFSAEPERQPGNLLRWTVAIPAGETIEMTYEFKSDY